MDSLQEVADSRDTLRDRKRLRAPVEFAQICAGAEPAGIAL